MTSRQRIEAGNSQGQPDLFFNRTFLFVRCCAPVVAIFQWLPRFAVPLVLMLSDTILFFPKALFPSHSQMASTHVASTHVISCCAPGNIMGGMSLWDK